MSIKVKLYQSGENSPNLDTLVISDGIKWRLNFITSVTCKKSPNVCKSCPKISELDKLKILTPLQKLPKNVRDFGKLIVTTGFEKLPKVQKIAQSGHTVHYLSKMTRQ